MSEERVWCWVTKVQIPLSDTFDVRYVTKEHLARIFALQTRTEFIISLNKHRETPHPASSNWALLSRWSHVWEHPTQRRDRLVKTLVSYSGDHGLKSRPWDRLSRLRLSLFSSVRPGRDSSLKLGHYRHLPRPFQFINRLSSFHSISYRQSVVK